MWNDKNNVMKWLMMFCGECEFENSCSPFKMDLNVKIEFPAPKNKEKDIHIVYFERVV